MISRRWSLGGAAALMQGRVAMGEAKPRLIIFAASRFCEKARWALDWHGIAYDEIGWPPGLHIMLAKRCGAKCSTLPILLDGAEVIQGSGAIIDWAEERAKHPGRSLNPTAARAEVREIEHRAGEVLGVHTRRLAFAEMLPDHAPLLKPSLFYRATGWRRLAGHIMWPGAWRSMMRLYDLKPGAAAESRAIIEVELAWLDDKLAHDRLYLAGDRLSRADLTVASLLSGFARPKELPSHYCMEGCDALAADVRRWSERPVMRWVRTQYRDHRRHPPSS